MIGAIVPYLQRIRRSYQSNDIIDRVNYHYTAMIVSLCAITLAATQYVGKPIQCWVPAQFTGAWEKYAETFCFIKGTYYHPDDQQISEDYIDREQVQIDYYQWVPLCMAFQAFLFFLPSLIWRGFNGASGINVKDVLESAAQCKKKFGSRSGQVQKAASHMKEALEMQRELHSDSLSLTRKLRKSGSYLTLLYIFTKVLYVANIFAQFVIFNIFLGTKSHMWGWEVLSDISNGREWQETGNFPRVTMCDFNVRVLGAMHRWTVQCVLMINMFTEKIYIALWFWFLIVGVLSVISLIYWLLALALTGNQRSFVAKYLRCNEQISDDQSVVEENRVASFVNNFLTPDGVFILRLIQTNGGDLLAGDIVGELYRYFEKRHEKPQAEEDFGDSPDTTATLPR